MSDEKSGIGAKPNVEAESALRKCPLVRPLTVWLAPSSAWAPGLPGAEGVQSPDPAFQVSTSPASGACAETSVRSARAIEPPPASTICARR